VLEARNKKILLPWSLSDFLQPPWPCEERKHSYGSYSIFYNLALPRKALMFVEKSYSLAFRPVRRGQNILAISLYYFTPLGWVGVATNMLPLRGW